MAVSALFGGYSEPSMCSFLLLVVGARCSQGSVWWRCFLLLVLFGSVLRVSEDGEMTSCLYFSPVFAFLDCGGMVVVWAFLRRLWLFQCCFEVF